jgi:hypothetical protein
MTAKKKPVVTTELVTITPIVELEDGMTIDSTIERFNNQVTIFSDLLVDKAIDDQEKIFKYIFSDYYDDYLDMVKEITDKKEDIATVTATITKGKFEYSVTAKK